ncbi:MAG: hypothetical protein IKZ08_01680, partial [Bacteroidales bacterium]|nr:hypothetical protein [Bacteroidales bacterium]
MNLRKSISLIMLAMLLALPACSGVLDDPTPTPPDTSETPDTQEKPDTPPAPEEKQVPQVTTLEA